MKSLFRTLFTLPRWITFPAVIGVLVGLVATCYPGGLTAAYTDVRDAHQLTTTLDECKESDQAMGHRLSNVKERIEYKEELVTALIRGQTTLAAVSEQFAAGHRADGKAVGLLRARFGDFPESELAACNVLDYVRMRTAPDGGSSVPLSRLHAEFEQLFGHPAPRG